MEALIWYSSAVIPAKAIEKLADDSGDDRYLFGMGRRAKTVRERVERRQTDTATALEKLFEEIEINDRRRNLGNGKFSTKRRLAGG